MTNLKKELEVAALENGTVIDHIPSNVLFKVVRLLELEGLVDSITIGNNLDSKKYGKKGIIKISNKFFEEEQINRIALIAPNAILNIIRDYKVAEKKSLIVPPVVKRIVKCNNPKCITNNEPMPTVFNVLDTDELHLKCRYCQKVVEPDMLVLL